MLILYLSAAGNFGVSLCNIIKGKIKPEVHCTSGYLATNHLPPHMAQEHTHLCQRNTHLHQNNSRMQQQKQQIPTPMGLSIAVAPHPPTCVWVGRVFI